MRFPFAFGFPAGGGFQLAFTDAIRSALKDGDVGVMGEAVEEGGDAGGIGEDGVPLFGGFIGRQQDGLALVTVVNDFEEQVGGGGVVSEIATFVNDQKGGAGGRGGVGEGRAGG